MLFRSFPSHDIKCKKMKVRTSVKKRSVDCMVVKAARQGEEAATLAKEAKAAEEARRARETAEAGAAGGKKPKKEVTVKGREHKVPCFHPFDKKKFMQMSNNDRKAYLKEMAAQLKRQENAINSLTVNEFKVARDAFNAVKRNPAANAAQEVFRKRVAADIKDNIFRSMQKGGLSAVKAKKAAAARTEEIMNKLAALHDPDMVAGGWMHSTPTGLGRADVNSSIGAGWNQHGRLSGIDKEVEGIIDSGRGDQKMNVKLEPCRGKDQR